MKPYTVLKSVAVAMLLSTSAITAYAATTDPAPVTAPSYKTQSAMLKTADEALNAVVNARAARLALFDNNIDEAKARLTKATEEFNVAEKGLNDLTIGDTEMPDNAARYLPFDMSMVLSDNFVPSEDATQALNQAGDQIKQGNTDQALETLRLASVDVNVSAALLPVADTSDQLEKAQTLMDQGKYFEANLQLKKIEDSVIIRSFSIDAIPQQGDAKG
ncbi:YfdX family protein [Mesobacterium sp. TK19101]|uniref:YfdX family protein n=1 Tax=Mesobacterium hydrothermale TaxID=3111907 RepID=A0ABU6HL92_9RHOB|nr:YfdX family protein [Mesobacterium sp. TK19101]MEC3862857.1 YfdX family protein [Mesobacterium sp. TK19101]